MKRSRRWVVGGLVAPLVICGGVTLFSAASNIGLPSESAVVDRLSEMESARLEEAFHLRQTLGDAAWPGWGSADIPAIVYNERYAFLVGLPEPAPGWVKVPQGSARGGPWEVVPDDRFEGEPYFRQVLPSGVTPEAFTVKVGDRWVSSLTTKEWMRIMLAEQFREDLPAFLRPIFPYRLVTSLFIDSSDFYISGLLHEAFHAYQGLIAPEKLAAAETAVRQSEARYPWEDKAFRDAWQVELDLMAKALRAGTLEETATLTREFLAHREQRRETLSADLVAYERHREWQEGLARYIELEIWRQAATASNYEPVPAVKDDPDFKSYRTFERRWSREVDQMCRMAGNRGDGRFYYSGMAQAVLLDRLAPGWKERAFDDGVWLDLLLADVLSP
jgi:hypothetical protein